jgi:ABC-2 type transport system ATP-binding protein
MLELIVRVHRMMGMSVVLSSHILEDIERVCDYVIIINGGELVLAQPIASGRPDDGELVVRLENGTQPFIERLSAYGIEDVRVLAHGQVSPFPELVIRGADDRAFDAIRDTAVDLGVPIRSLRGRSHSLEELYLSAVERHFDVDSPGGAHDER